MPYVKEGGGKGIIKGYICPVGQVCKVCPTIRVDTPHSTIYQEGENPSNNIESYDNFFYAVLQVAIISTQSGVCFDFRLSCADGDTIL